MRTVQLLKKPGDEIGDLDIVIARGAVAEQRIGDGSVPQSMVNAKLCDQKS